MIKMNLGWNDERQATEIAFGLSAANLRKLQENAPIYVNSHEVNLDPQILGFVIFFCNEEEERFKVDLERVCHQLGIKLNEEVPVMNLENTFYVIPITFEKGIFYLMGLHDKSYEVLRAKKHLTFRARVPECQEQSVEVVLFAGETEEQMAEELKAMMR